MSIDILDYLTKNHFNLTTVDVILGANFLENVFKYGYTKNLTKVIGAHEKTAKSSIRNNAIAMEFSL